MKVVLTQSYKVKKLDINIYCLDNRDILPWEEVNELLQDSIANCENFDENKNYFRYVKKCYALTTKYHNYDCIKIKNEKDLWSYEFEQVINSPEESLYMYKLAYCDEYYGNKRYSLELPIYDYDDHSYIIILLKK